MKQLLSLILALSVLLCGSIVVSPVSAAPPEATLHVSCPEKVSPGEEFDLSLTLTAPQGKGIGAYFVEISFDSRAFRPIFGGDAVHDGRILFCDSSESPMESLVLSVRFLALSASQNGLSLSQVQLVDFDSMTPISITPASVPVLVILDPLGRGDMDQNGRTDSGDAIYLLFHTLFGQDYRLGQDGDVDQNGSVDSDDAIYLLFFTLFPLSYPLN